MKNKGPKCLELLEESKQLRSIVDNMNSRFDYFLAGKDTSGNFRLMLREDAKYLKAELPAKTAEVVEARKQLVKQRMKNNPPIFGRKKKII